MPFMHAPSCFFLHCVVCMYVRVRVHKYCIVCRFFSSLLTFSRVLLVRTGAVLPTPTSSLVTSVERWSCKVHGAVSWWKLKNDANSVSWCTVFVNRDQLTGFGTPWEIQFQANYTVLRKGGNVDGYSALLSYIPDLKLGIKLTFAYM